MADAPPPKTMSQEPNLFPAIAGASPASSRSVLSRVVRPMTERKLFWWVVVLAAGAVSLAVPQFVVDEGSRWMARSRTLVSLWLGIAGGTLALLLQARRHYIAHALEVSKGPSVSG